MSIIEKSEFVENLKKSIRDKTQHKVFAVALGLSPAELSKKLANPLKSFAPPEVKVLRYLTATNIGELTNNTDEVANWIFATDLETMRAFKALNQRVTKMETLLNEINSKLK